MDVDFLTEVMDTPGLSVWAVIMIGVYILGWIFTFIRLLRGGFRDLREIAGSRYATTQERERARNAMPARLALLVIASGVGAAGIAIAVFLQGAALIFLYQQIVT